MSTVTEEFSRFAIEYKQYNIIQEKVAQELISMISLSPSYDAILDIGCGSGLVFDILMKQKVDIKRFFALDASTKMLEVHPSSQNIIKIKSDFNLSFSKTLPKDKIEMILSSSALQWSSDLGSIFNRLSLLSDRHYYAIFTSNTFKTLHKVAKVTSPIYTSEKLKRSIECAFKQSSFSIKNYQLKFNSTREMLTYIKKSGVSGGEKKLTYLQTKQLIKSYPLDYLEFEVLFVKAIN